MNTKILLLYFISFVLFVACQKHVDYSLEYVLKQAGANRMELEKVLEYYGKNPEDSLKYKAALFLIQNMLYDIYYEGEQLENYKNYYPLLKESKITGVEASVIADSLKEMYGDFLLQELQLKKDIEELDSAYLCNNIEWAFKVWQEQPWGKNVSFHDFCEYILPYRIGDEQPEYWREDLYDKYNHLLQSWKDSIPLQADDPIKAVWVLMEHIADREDVYFTTTAPANLPHIGPTLVQLKTGSCRELTDYMVYVCRALGIPCHIDFIPIRGRDNVGHFWISYFDKNGELYSQDFPESVTNVRINGIKNDPKTKVYRYTFSVNREMKELFAQEESIPDLFKTFRFIDVTYLYTNQYREKIIIPFSKLYQYKTNGKVAYLYACQGLSWAPVAYAPFSENNIVFHNLQAGDILRVATGSREGIVFQSDPFRIEPYTNQLRFLSGSDTLQTISLHSKFDTWSEGLFKDRMLGGVFEGSNDPDFLNKDTLYLINEVPERLNTVVNSWSDKKYRYIRYYGAAETYCNISEVVFYEKESDTIPLQGKNIGTPGSADPHGQHEYTNVFDEKTWTSFDYKEPSGGWSGLDLGEPKTISKIIYTPRNRDNYIRPGDTFELFYMDRMWKSLGQIVSCSDSLVYENVPENSLLYLRCHSRGQQERIFTYEDGKQVWW